MSSPSPVYAGIDPGKSGAVAFINDAGLVMRLSPIPLVESAKGGRDEYNLPAIADLFRVGGVPLFVTLEKSQPLPAFIGPRGPDGKQEQISGGSVANYNRGLSRGFEWMLVAMRIPYQLVAPRTWQAAMHAGAPGSDTKQRSILAAQRLFPGVSLRRTALSRKPHDGIAEALLLAEYGRRTYAGTLGWAQVAKDRRA